MNIAYIRVSATDQNEARQIELAKSKGVEKFFIDKQSGKDAERPQLKALLSFAREGDTVFVESISRLARNVRDLLAIVDELKTKGVAFVSLKESIDTTTPTGKFCLTLFGALAEMERETILDRQREGIELAKRRGVYKGRQAAPIDEERFRSRVLDYQAGKRTVTNIAREFGITNITFYRWCKKRGYKVRTES